MRKYFTVKQAQVQKTMAHCWAYGAKDWSNGLDAL
jgi:hypothetical protein